MIHKVVQVIPTRDYTVYVYFEDGRIVCYDMSSMLLDGTVFQPLKDIEVFMNTCTVLNDTLAFDIAGNRDEWSCVDIDPETLYELPEVQDLIA